MINLNSIAIQSVGSMMIFGLTLLAFVFLLWFHRLLSKEEWVIWGAAVALGTMIYSLGVFINYNSTGIVNQIAEKMQYTGILLLIHSLVCFTQTYFNKSVRRYQFFAVPVHLIFLLVIWFTPLIISDGFVFRNFSWMDKPYVEPALGPLGIWFLSYVTITTLATFALWIRNHSYRKNESRFFIGGFIFWLLLGLHDFLVTLGMPSKIFLTEYGFLGFMLGIMSFTMISYKSMVKSLTMANKREAIGTMASGVAHDFNNTLQAINGYLSELRRSSNLSDDDLLTLVKTEVVVQRGAALVRSLLFISRDIDVEFTRFDLNTEVLRSVDILSRTMPKVITIKTEIAPKPLNIQGDASQIGQVLLNLSNNSRDAMPQGGILSIQTIQYDVRIGSDAYRQGIPAGNYAKIIISDTGFGMDYDVMHKAFDPFFTTKDPSQGTGLGLAAAKNIIFNHSGHITLSSSPNSGTSIHLLLPLDMTATIGKEEYIRGDTIQSNDISCNDKFNSYSLLVVDDEQPILETTVAGLQCTGYLVTGAQNGEEALKIIKDNKQEFDLVLLDLNMPGMGGEQCLYKLRTLKPELKVLISSGYLLDPKANERILGEADGYISKPYNLNELNNKISALLTH